MKIKHIFSGLLAGLALLATSCSTAEIDLPQGESQENQQAGQVVRLTVSAAQDDTRLGIADNGTQLDFTWEETDQVKVYNVTQGTQTVFSVEKESIKGAMATLKGTPAQPFQPGDVLRAVFNKNPQCNQTDVNGNPILDLTGQNGTLNEKYQYMYAETKFQGEATPALAFRHMVSIFKVEIPVTEGLSEISEITLSAGGNSIYPKAILNLSSLDSDNNNVFQPGDLVYPYTSDAPTNPGITQTQHISTSLTPVNGKFTAYIYYLPAKIFWGDNSYNNTYAAPSFILKDKSGAEFIHTNSFREKRIQEPGKTYNLALQNLVRIVDFENEATADGNSIPYEIANVDQYYSWMLRCHTNALDKYGNEYKRSNYKLTSDIVLDDRTDWKYMQCVNMQFDGQSHTVSGNITLVSDEYCVSTFIAHANTCTILNLTIDVKICKIHGGIAYFGAFCGECYSSQFINCHNHSDISGSFGYAGGIAGCSYQSQYIACSNSGNISIESLHDQWHSIIQLGGIVGSVNWWSQDSGAVFTGCSNTGSFTVNSINTSEFSIGGIAGALRSDYGVIFKANGCWTSGQTTIDSIMTDANLYTGGILGYTDPAQLKACYWQENSAEASASAASGLVEETDCGSFSGSHPSASQISLMNASLEGTGFEYDANGVIHKSNKTTLPTFDKEQW